MEHASGQSIGEIMRERNIELATLDPVARGGFTQVPNFILRDGTLSLGAKVSYSMFLHFDWYNAGCFPGQETLAEHMTSIYRSLESGRSITRIRQAELTPY